MSIHDITSMVDYLKARFPDNGKTTGQSVQAVCSEVERGWDDLRRIRDALEMPDADADEVVSVLKRAIAENGARIDELAALKAPVPMHLYCPMCGGRHIDKGRFATHPHATHSCQHAGCGHTWRPAIVATVGVEFLPGFKDSE